MGHVVKMKATKEIKQRAKALPEPGPIHTEGIYAISLEDMTPYQLVKEMHYMVELLQEHEEAIGKEYNVMLNMLWSEFEAMRNIFGYAENWGKPREEENNEPSAS